MYVVLLPVLNDDAVLFFELLKLALLQNLHLREYPQLLTHRLLYIS